MIEIVEAVVFSKQIKEGLMNKEIKDCQVEVSPHKFCFYTKEKSFYKEMLVGKVFTDCQPNGGQIEMMFEDIHLLLTDGANFMYYTDKKEIPKKHQLLLEFTDNTYFVVSIRMYGGVMVFKKGTLHWEYYTVQRSKPNVLSDDFSFSYFLGLIDKEKPSLTVKALLATEQRIPGLGNGCLQDILFQARINPRKKIGTLTEQDKASLFWAIKNTLSDMIYKGGRDTETDMYGNKGGYKLIMGSKGLDVPCMHCGSMIVKEAFMGGSVYYCPICQPRD